MDNAEGGAVYLTLEEFRLGVQQGVFGPDEDCRWVSITELGSLIETPITNLKEHPANTIAVIYYAA